MQITTNSPIMPSHNIHNVGSLSSRSKTIIIVALAALSVLAGALTTFIGLLPGVVVSTGVLGSIFLGTLVGSLIFAVAQRCLMATENHPPQVVVKTVYVPQRVEVIVEKQVSPKSAPAPIPKPVTPEPVVEEPENVTAEFYRLAHEQCILDLQHSAALQTIALKKDEDLKVRTSTFTKEIKREYILRRWEQIFKNFDSGQFYLNGCVTSIRNKIIQSDDKMMQEDEMKKRIEALQTLRVKWLNNIREVEDLKVSMTRFGSDPQLLKALGAAQQEILRYEGLIKEDRFASKAAQRSDFCDSKISTTESNK